MYLFRLWAPQGFVLMPLVCTSCPVIWIVDASMIRRVCTAAYTLATCQGISSSSCLLLPELCNWNQKPSSILSGAEDEGVVSDFRPSLARLAFSWNEKMLAKAWIHTAHTGQHHVRTVHAWTCGWSHGETKFPSVAINEVWIRQWPSWTCWHLAADFFLIFWMDCRG